MNTDPIADMLNRIKTAQAVSKPAVELPFSNLKYEIAKVMEKEGLLEKVIKKKKQSLRFLHLVLKYEEGAPIITEIHRISSPGQRIYSSAKDISKIKGGIGVLILSTSKGIMTGEEARKNAIGGEKICEIW